ncbi:hypothetical protein C8F04DRAFT_1197418 [Mycena alexandri]|uniref:Uncharacterized protein n=1 Tax=Mycena alexandri TaxID=1745969 RepID=A0AAD6S282_9AGAR|nr:hypothetical protein C8F04DRAFT_1197418 [Mycena alexandri]
MWAPPSPSHSNVLNSNVPLSSTLDDVDVDLIVGKGRESGEEGKKEDGGSTSPEQSCKCCYNVIGNLVSVRYSLLEGSRRLESLLVREKDLLQIQLLNDYAIKRLLAPGFLNQPEIATSVSDPESSSSDKGPGYPGGLAAPAAGAATAAAGVSSLVGEGISGSMSSRTSSRTSSPNPASLDDGQRGESSNQTDNTFIFREHNGDRRVEPHCNCPPLEFRYDQVHAEIQD